jgi:hypothetical protein
LRVYVTGGELFGAVTTDKVRIGIVAVLKRREAVLEEDATPDPMVDPDEMLRVNRQSTLVRLARMSQNP